MFLFDPPENIRKPFQVGQKETLGREGLSHLRQVFHSYKNRDFFFFFFCWLPHGQRVFIEGAASQTRF